MKAGGGLTIGSEPAAEVQEAKLKAAKLVEAAFGGCLNGWSKSTTQPLAPGKALGNECEKEVAHHAIEPLNVRVESFLEAFTESSTRRPCGTVLVATGGSGTRPVPLFRCGKKARQPAIAACSLWTTSTRSA